MRASGLCGSDLRPYRAPASERRVVCGHEPCGVVATLGPAVTDRQARMGQRVMVHHYRGCGTCKHCRIGYTQMCVLGAQVMGFSANGGNAPLLVAPATALVPLPDELSFEAPDLKKKNVKVDSAYVNKQLAEIVKNQDLSRYIL